mmetsp:Transcript_30860/g.73325  ORF Transcript_30860/g.73325 Transcript_30860/m.73325 type:complete len:377 (-) Transcript_30860:2759-3889(-)
MRLGVHDRARPAPQDLLRVRVCQRPGRFRAPLIDDGLLEFGLALRHDEDLLLNARPGDEPKDYDGAGLPDPVRPSQRLHVAVGVEVRVVQNDRICGREVDALPARARREQEHEHCPVLIVELVDEALALVARDVSVDPHVRVSEEGEELLEDVEHRGELREDQDLGAILEQLRQDLLEEDELSRSAREKHVFCLLGRCGGDGRVEEVRVVAALAQLHQHVEERNAAVVFVRTVEDPEVARQARGVVLALDGRKAHLHHPLDLGREFEALLVLLEPPEHEGSQRRMQGRHLRVGALAREFGLESLHRREEVGRGLIRAFLLALFVSPLLLSAFVLRLPRDGLGQERHEVEEFVEVVLQRRPRQEHLICCAEPGEGPE